MTEPTFRMTRKYTQDQIVNIASMIEKTKDSGNAVVLKPKTTTSALKKSLIEAGVPKENFLTTKDNTVQFFCLNGGRTTEIWDFFYLIESQIKLQSLKDARLKLEKEIADNEKRFLKTFQETVKQK